MIKVVDKEAYFHLFKNYKHNIPVIYASLEGQYDGELYVDSEFNPQIAVLFTPFAFHFVAGDAGTNDVVNVLDALIFKHHLTIKNQKEAIFFSPDAHWDQVLDQVFSKRNGIKDSRKIFHLNREKFKTAQSTRKNLDPFKNQISYEQDGGSTIPYPVSRIFKDSECVCFCSGFMLGQGHAEIDVATVEAYRGKGFAKEASIALIESLLNSEMEPNWCTWPYRKESEKLAIALGFELVNEIPAHIWVEEACGKIE